MALWTVFTVRYGIIADVYDLYAFLRINGSRMHIISRLWNLDKNEMNA